METQTSAIVVDRSVIDDLDCPRRNESCSLCGKRGHLSHVCRSSGGNAIARAVNEPEEEREIQHVWALSVCDISGIPLDVLSVCDYSDLPSDESGNLLVWSLTLLLRNTWCPWQTGKVWVSRCEFLSFVVRGWCDNQMVELTALMATRAARSLCSATKLVSAGCSIEMRPTQSVLRRSGGGCILLQRCGKRDFLSI